MVLNPAAFIESINFCEVLPPPHALSSQTASKVLPKFNPTCMRLANSGAVGNWAKVFKLVKRPVTKTNNLILLIIYKYLRVIILKLLG